MGEQAGRVDVDAFLVSREGGSPVFEGEEGLDDVPIE